MAKKSQAAKLTDTFDTVKPYLERALHDDDFRNDLKDALQAARELYGPLSKQNGVANSARVLATDKKAQEQLKRALDDLTSAKDTLKGKKKSHKGRNMVLLAGVIAGALYNPWTGPQTREKLMDLIAGDDDLQPLETFDAPASDAVSKAESATHDAADSASRTAQSGADSISDAATATKAKASKAADKLDG
jgi:hypothetical protein